MYSKTAPTRDLQVRSAIRLLAALVFLTAAWIPVVQANTVTPIPTGDCISTVHPCVTVPLMISRGDAVPMRGYSVELQISPELVLCSGPSSITQGSYLPGTTSFQVIDHGGGAYTVDQAILGLPCGAVNPSGTLFSVEVKNAGADGAGTITAGAVFLRDCNNAPLPAAAGPPATIYIDRTPPLAVADLVAPQVKVGNDTDGTTRILLTFAAPGDAFEIEAYRAWYGTTTANAYPEYDDMPGAGAPVTPAYPPGPPWQATPVTASGQTDEPGQRGLWYYAVFTHDECGNVSPVSNVTPGTLNYHLGDVTPLPAGDNDVDGLDISALGGSYGQSLVYSDPINYLDVGPTSDWSVDGRPLTDNRVDFEDLMVFAMNYGQVSFAGPIPSQDQAGPGGTPFLAIQYEPVTAKGILVAHLMLRKNTAEVKGSHAVISYDPERIEVLEVCQGRLLQGQNGVFFHHLPGTGAVTIDAAALGQGIAIQGSGEVAVIRVRLFPGSGRLQLKTADLRDLVNGCISANPTGTQPGSNGSGQAPLALARATAPKTPVPLARPNPFGQSTTIEFRLPEEGTITVRIFNAAGAMVRTLVDGNIPGGEHHVSWDGRNAEGQRAPVGVYFCTLRTASAVRTIKLFCYR
jgi:hypothetical protein